MTDDQAVADQIIAWLRRQASAERASIKRAAFVQAHNAALRIKSNALLAALSPADRELVEDVMRNQGVTVAEAIESLKRRKPSRRLRK
jgi:cephalosporin-C deacetylase-like acetyl esterase